MSIWKRVSSLIKNTGSAPEPAPVQENPFEDTRPGDILNVDLEEYVVTGKLVYFDRGFPPHRYAYYLQNGKDISCLLIEKGRTYDCFLCWFVEGALDDPGDVPTILEVGEGITYELEHHRSDLVLAEGATDFRNNDTVLIWRYFAGGGSHFFLQWQDGKYVAMEGERTPGSQISFLKGSKRPGS